MQNIKVHSIQYIVLVLSAVVCFGLAGLSIQSSYRVAHILCFRCAGMFRLCSKEPHVGLCHLWCVPVHWLLRCPPFAWCAPQLCPVRLGGYKAHSNRCIVIFAHSRCNFCLCLCDTGDVCWVCLWIMMWGTYLMCQLLLSVCIQSVDSILMMWSSGSNMFCV